MKKNLIVSSADNKYSKLLIELYLSLKKLNDYDFAILDCGLSNSDQVYFQNLNIQITKPIWEYPLPKLKVRGREYLKIQF